MLVTNTFCVQASSQPVQKKVPKEVVYTGAGQDEGIPFKTPARATNTDQVIHVHQSTDLLLSR